MPNWVNLPLIFSVTISEPIPARYLAPRFLILGGGKYWLEVGPGRRIDEKNGLELSHEIGKTALEILIAADFQNRVALLFDEMLTLWVSPAAEEGNENFSYDPEKRLLVPKVEYLEAFFGNRRPHLELPQSLAFEVLSISLDSPVVIKSGVKAALQAFVLATRILIPTVDQIKTVVAPTILPVVVEIYLEDRKERHDWELRGYDVLQKERDSGSRRPALQRDLADLGYDPGPKDRGIVGPRLKKAVAAYAKDKGLPPGIGLDDDLLLKSIASDMTKLK